MGCDTDYLCKRHWGIKHISSLKTHNSVILISENETKKEHSHKQVICIPDNGG